jgi:diguanylate cyclase (GGDEF)-like protein
LRILIADNDSNGRGSLRHTLEGWGFEVAEAEDGDEALDVLSGSHPPTLAILDEATAGNDGVAACKEIRRRSHGPYVYIIILFEAARERRDLLAALESGADEVLTRPYDLSELRARICVGRRIVELQDELLAARESIRTQASHDSLTGLLTRGAILDVLQREASRAERLGQAFGILLVDLDHFKKVNDVHGHLVGDAVLREAARRMANSVRPYDTVGRYGGEEFLITLPGCDEKRSMTVAERLRKAVAGAPFRCMEIDLAITASLGAAVFDPASCPPLDSLVHAADSALYRAKDGGRNQASLAPREAPRGTEAAEVSPCPTLHADNTWRPEGDLRTAPVELSRLREISCDDDALRAELLDLFVVSTAPRLPSLRTALESGNAALAEAEAHAIKGASAHLGAAHLGDIAFRLERASREGDLALGPPLIRELETEFERVRTFIDRLSHEDSQVPGSTERA